jgi:nuclear pore complex protein Nup133
MFANIYFQMVLKSALELRDQNLPVYGIQLPMRNAWTAKEGIINVVTTLFDTTADAISSNPESEQENSELHVQIPQLANILFASIRERLDWLERCVLLPFADVLAE